MNVAPFLDQRLAVRLTGAVYTPSEVATALINFAITDLPNRPLRILEPSVGDGAFLGELAKVLYSHDYVAVDINQNIISDLQSIGAFWPQSTEFHAEDFIGFACNEIKMQAAKYDLIIGNPPFIRKHNYSDDFKETIRQLSELVRYPVADMKNSWAAFLVAASKLLSDDGTVAFVLPYELITVTYGHTVLREMLSVFSRIDLVISDEKAFPDIEQDAVLFIGRKSTMTTKGLYIQRVKQMSELSNAVEHHIPLDADSPLSLSLNAFLINAEMMPILQKVKAEFQRFSDLATSAPGVVTAANNFFILKDVDVDQRALRKYAVPILKKQNLIDRSPIFSKKDFNRLAKREPSQLLLIKGDLDDLDDAAKEYIASGVEDGLPNRYKCRGRKNWYEVRIVPTAPIIFFKRSHGFPRLCINAAGVHITDTAYGVHPKEGYTIRGICFSFYNSLTMLFAEIDGRFYGGGVLEVSPNELKGLPILYHEPTDEEFQAFVEVHKRATNDPEPILDFGDRWLQQDAAAAKLDLGAVREAWKSVRAHRLRHSSRNK